MTLLLPATSGTMGVVVYMFFLFGSFREGYEYWEAVVLKRKFAIMAAGVLLADNAFGL